MILAGFDSGSSWAAATVLDVPPDGRPTLIQGATHTWELGHWEQLAEPKPYMQKNLAGDWEPQIGADGQPRMRTQRHVFTMAEAEDKAEEIVKWMLKHGAEGVFIEDVERLTPGETVASTTAMGTANIEASKLAAIVFSKAKAARLTVATLTNQQARGIGVGGIVKGRGQRAEEVLCAEVIGWAERVREDAAGTRPEHERDAGVIALAGVRLLRGEAEKSKPKPRTRVRTPSSSTKRKRILSDEERRDAAKRQKERQQEARAERLAAAGVEPSGKRVQLCAKCGQVRLGHVRGLPCPESDEGRSDAA